MRALSVARPVGSTAIAPPLPPARRGGTPSAYFLSRHLAPRSAGTPAAEPKPKYTAADHAALYLASQTVMSGIAPEGAVSGPDLKYMLNALPPPKGLGGDALKFRSAAQRARTLRFTEVAASMATLMRYADKELIVKFGERAASRLQRAVAAPVPCCPLPT